MLMPISGYTIAYLAAKLMCQRWREARTIAVETGIQNAGEGFVLFREGTFLLGIAILICQFSLYPPDSDMTIVMPVCCLLFTSAPLWMWLLGRTIAKKKFGKDFRNANNAKKTTTGWIDKEVAADEAALKALKSDQSLLVH